MNWYYAREGRQVGPLSEDDLKTQVAAGVIRADTLVWHEGMGGWQAYGSVASGTDAGAPASRPTCTQCGRAFAPEEMILAKKRARARAYPIPLPSGITTLRPQTIFPGVAPNAPTNQVS